MKGTLTDEVGLKDPPITLEPISILGQIRHSCFNLVPQRIVFQNIIQNKDSSQQSHPTFHMLEKCWKKDKAL